jgi:hypothetical protein
MSELRYSLSTLVSKAMADYWTQKNAMLAKLGDTGHDDPNEIEPPKEVKCDWRMSSGFIWECRTPGCGARGHDTPCPRRRQPPAAAGGGDMDPRDIAWD